MKVKAGLAIPLSRMAELLTNSVKSNCQMIFHTYKATSYCAKKWIIGGVNFKPHFLLHIATGSERGIQIYQCY